MEALEQADYVMFDYRDFQDGIKVNALKHQIGEVYDAQLGKNDFLCRCNTLATNHPE